MPQQTWYHPLYSNIALSPSLFGWIGMVRHDRHSLSSRTLGYQQNKQPSGVATVYSTFSFPKVFSHPFYSTQIKTIWFTIQKVKTTSDSSWILQTDLDNCGQTSNLQSALPSRTLYSASSLLSLF